MSFAAMTNSYISANIARPMSRRAISALAVRIAVMFLVGEGVVERAAAQLCVQLNGSAYKQDFNTLAVSGTSNVSGTIPIGFAFSESGTGNNVTYAADSGASSTGNTFSYGTGTNADRAFGELDGDTGLTSIVGGCFVNNTGFMINSLSIGYTGEQWRFGADDGNTDRLDFQFSTTALSLNDGGLADPKWTDVNTLDFVSPVNTGTVGTRDGNAVGNRTPKTPTAIIPASGIPFSSTFFIRWFPTNITGADDGLAIDDFTLTYGPMPDFDLDRDVDGADFLAMQRNLIKKSGASITQGDANKDGAVDKLDLFIWGDRFGTTADAPPIGAIPEPATAGLMASAVLALAALRRRA
jgi:hypothetical protein